MDLEGPVTDKRTGAQSYTVHGEERDIHFAIERETLNGKDGWGVHIEGVPGPSIVHQEPWPSPEAARDAALAAVRTMLELDRMQREDQRQQDPDGEEECADR
jgi:hypothetical protein